MLNMVKIFLKQQLHAYITLVLTFYFFMFIIIPVNYGWMISFASIVSVTSAWRISDLSYIGLTIIMFLISIVIPIMALQIIIWMYLLPQSLLHSEFHNIFGLLLLSFIVSIIWFWVLKHLE